MKNAECARIREAFRTGPSTPEQERHLFSCAACRAAVRLAQAWKALPRSTELESRPAPDEVFVERVLRDVREDRRRRARVQTGLAAAAALLFFFLAGAAGQIAATATDTGDDAYAQLVTPSDSELETLLPQ